jgi:hypothetical protein
MSSHSSTNPTDDELLKKQRDDRDFVARSVADAANRADEKNEFGPDVERENQKKMASLAAQIITKRQARNPGVVRRKSMALRNNTHSYVSMIQQANANFAAEVNKYNRVFTSSTGV